MRNDKEAKENEEGITTLAILGPAIEGTHGGNRDTIPNG